MSRKRKHKTKLPKDNGRPQLWMRDTGEIGAVADYYERLRIIYPDGKAEYSTGSEFFFWEEPCWQGRKGSTEQLTKRMLAYDKRHDYKTIFLGYL